MRYRLLALILGPFVMWSIYFIGIYGVQAVGCKASWDMTFIAGIPLLRWVLVAMLAASAAMSVLMYYLATRIDTDQPSIKRIGYYCAAAGLFSTVIIFPGVFWLELC